jgi:hypothetical protein
MPSMKFAVLFPCALGLWALLLASAHAAGATPAPCRPCGEWQLDPAASDAVAPAIDAAMARYKAPRRRRIRAPRDDIDAQTQAEFEASLDEPVPGGPGSRNRLRENLQNLLDPPASLRVRQEGGDVVIEAPGETRRVTPGEPHSRVDSLGTARIVSEWRRGGLTVTESYRRRTSNREIYALDAQGRLVVTRTISRPGLPSITLRSSYAAR